MGVLVSLLVVALSSRAAELQVSAAASLADALTEIGRDYERTTGTIVRFNFGASSMLQRQIEMGAPADVFISADEAKVRELARAGRVPPRSSRRLLSNSLVVVVPVASRTRLASLQSLAGLATIAIAEPSTVPAGIYARAALERAGVWPKLTRAIVPTENVRAALAAVVAGNADAAIVYRTDALTALRDVRIAYQIPTSLTPDIAYVAAVVEGASPGARRFYDALFTAKARRVFERYGFVVR